MIEHLIATYGYAIIALGTFFEGETVLVIGGYIAHLGHLKLEWVIASAFIGTLAGDQLFFFIGRKKGMSMIEKRPVWKKKSKRIFSLMHRHKNLLILGFRFIYGIRTVAPFLIGASGVPPLKFILLNVTGAFIWAVTIGTLGYLLGNTIELFLNEAKKYELVVIAVLILAAAGVWIFRYFREKKEIDS